MGLGTSRCHPWRSRLSLAYPLQSENSNRRRHFRFILKGATDEPLTIEIKTPELEALIQERLMNGGFTNLDELLTKALESLQGGVGPAPSPKAAKRLVDV